ncbi:MAG: DegT/DnrJ/EryC1/StrS family aminotransferase [Candidatus Omnitrophica bacterium]|nr:DegT/DnrJ/EryC1/StrS family aminotransferase [Candidatus Omnitrophota bacterium]
MNIPFNDLKIQYDALKTEFHQAIDRVLESQGYILGPEVEAFEKAFAAYCGTRYAVGVNSGTMALQLALLALDVKPGDEIITVAQTFIATAEAISWCGATPVFIDVEDKTYTLNPALIEKAITPKTRGIIPVHLYGHPANMRAVSDIAKRHGLFILEDAAQAHGAQFQAKRVGGFGEAACFSFYPGKNLGAFGEGGAVVTNDEKIALEVKKLRNHGGLVRYVHERLGFNGRMEAIQGAVLSVKLPHLDQWNENRRRNARLYHELLRGLELQLPIEAEGCQSVYNGYVIRSKKRDALQKFLSEAGIQTMIYYPVKIHLLDFYKHLGYREGSLPVTEALCAEGLALPVYPDMKEEQVRYVAETIRRFSA